MGDLTDLQRRISFIRRERGFTTDPVRMMVLLSEEVGEIAAELKRTWSPNYAAFDPKRLSDELADAFVMLAAIASEFNVDLASAVDSKFVRKDGEREWRSARSLHVTPDATDDTHPDG